MQHDVLLARSNFNPSFSLSVNPFAHSLCTSLTQSISNAVRGALSDRTYEHLRSLIVRGRIPPGSRVVELEIAGRFGVSRTPVRDAIARLVQEGYLAPVSASRRTEVVVTPLDTDQVTELWGMIASLEAIAIEAITKLPGLKRSRLADDLERLNGDLRDASKARPRDPDKLFALQTAFHMRFVEETAGPHLKRTYANLRPQVQRYEWAYGTRLEAEYEPSADEHLRIIAAIREGDSDAAHKSLIAHWSRAAERTVATIKRAVASPAPRRKARR